MMKRGRQIGTYSKNVKKPQQCMNVLLREEWDNQMYFILMICGRKELPWQRWCSCKSVRHWRTRYLGTLHGRTAEKNPRGRGDSWRRASQAVPRNRILSWKDKEALKDFCKENTIIFLCFSHKRKKKCHGLHPWSSFYRYIGGIWVVKYGIKLQELHEAEKAIKHWLWWLVMLLQPSCFSVP